jgi:hypothetical protein
MVYELVGGGPMDGDVGHMYTPTPIVKFVVQNNPDVVIASAGVPTPMVYYHTYKLRNGTQTRLFYCYEGIEPG